MVNLFLFTYGVCLPHSSFYYHCVLCSIVFNNYTFCLNFAGNIKVLLISS